MNTWKSLDIQAELFIQHNGKNNGKITVYLSLFFKKNIKFSSERVFKNYLFNGKNTLVPLREKQKRTVTFGRFITNKKQCYYRNQALMV